MSGRYQMGATVSPCGAAVTSSKITAVGNASCGILAHSRCTVTGNIVFDNGTYGVKTFYGSTVTDNTAYNNQSRGIDAEHEGCTVTGNTASYNNSGIAAGGGSTVVGNTAYYNWYYGIAAGDGSLVANNVTSYNNQSNSTINAGIRVGEDCLVKGNVAHANKQYNILVGGLGFGPFTDNVIEENLVTDSANGIFFDPIAGTGNFYANNRASGNTTNYANTVGNTNGGGNFSF